VARHVRVEDPWPFIVLNVAQMHGVAAARAVMVAVESGPISMRSAGTAATLPWWLPLGTTAQGGTAGAGAGPPGVRRGVVALRASGSWRRASTTATALAVLRRPMRVGEPEEEEEEEQQASAAAGRLRWPGCPGAAPRPAAWTSALMLPALARPRTYREHLALVKRAETLALAASMCHVATEELTRPPGRDGAGRADGHPQAQAATAVRWEHGPGVAACAAGDVNECAEPGLGRASMARAK